MYETIESASTLRPQVYVVLPGSVGTLGELVLVWNHINIDFRVNHTCNKHLICFRSPWEDFVINTTANLHLGDHDLSNIHFVDTVDEAVDLSRRLLDTQKTY
jgi:predicted Rossmann-fold nucleotide-binding protein